MKKAIATFFLLIFVIQIGLANGTLSQNTIIPVRVTENMSSQNNESVQLIVAEDIKDSNGNTIIQENSVVKADVRRHKKGAVGESGQINIRLRTVKATNGETIMLIGKHEEKPKNRKGKVMGIGLGLGLTIALPMLFFLFKKGDSASIDQGTIINAKPAKDYGF